MGSRGRGTGGGREGGFPGSASHRACFCSPEPPSRVPQAAGHSWEQASLPVLLRAPGVLQTVGVRLAQLALCAPRPPCSTVRHLKVRVPPPLEPSGGALTFFPIGDTMGARTPPHRLPSSAEDLRVPSPPLCFLQGGALGLRAWGLVLGSLVLTSCWSSGRSDPGPPWPGPGPVPPESLSSSEAPFTGKRERGQGPSDWREVLLLLAGPHPSKPRPLPSLTASRGHSDTPQLREATASLRLVWPSCGLAPSEAGRSHWARPSFVTY